MDGAHPGALALAAVRRRDGLRRRPRPGGAVRRLQRQRPASATPGPGTARTGPSSTPRTRPRRGRAWGWPTTPRTARSCCSAASTARATLGDTWTWDGTDWTEQQPRALAPAAVRAWGWPTTPPAARSCCSVGAATTVPRRHLDLGRHGLDEAHPGALALLRETRWRWPTTPPAARSCCSAGTTAATPARRHLDLGRHGLDAARSRALALAPRGTGDDGLRRGPRPGRPLRRQRRHGTTSATPGPGTARTGRNVLWRLACTITGTPGTATPSAERPRVTPAAPLGRRHGPRPCRGRRGVRRAWW